MKFLSGLVIGLVLATGVSVYATRLETPPTFYDFTNPNELTNLNNLLQKIQTIVNGNITFDVRASVPTTGSEGNVKFYSSGGTYKMLVYLNGGWREWTSD